jgi:hypothetical protein
MNKRGQLGIIEFKFFLYGLVFGLIVGFLLVYLGNTGVIPFEVPLVCASATV